MRVSTEREFKTMTKIKTTRLFGLPLAIAAAGLAIAMPAQAQARDHAHHAPAWQLTPARNAEIRQDVASLRNAIDRAAARRTISQREAAGLRSEARAIQQTHQRYARDGLSRAEVRTLQDRVNRVRVALRMERRDWDGHRG